MGRRSEQRIAFRVPILVHGKDGRGTPFTVNAQALDITATGASLNGLKGIADIGSKVEIEYRGRTAWYRIQWIGKIGTPRAGHAGVKCLEPGKYIWGDSPPEWVEDTYDHQNTERPKPSPVPPLSDFVSPPAPQSERRRFPRVSCRIEASVVDAGSAVGLPAKVTDISLGGCYVEMLSPLPAGSPIELILDVNQTVVRAQGRVLSSQGGMGMGVAFTAIAPEDFEKLREIAPPMPQDGGRENARPKPAVHSPVAPSNGAGATPRALQIAPTTQEVLESVLRILLRKGIVSEEEMAEEFEKLMIAKS